LDTPLRDFSWKVEKLEDGSKRYREDPFGEGIPQLEMRRLWVFVRYTYEDLLLSEEEDSHFEPPGHVPVIRGGERVYEDLNLLTLRDLPAILDTFVVLEEELRVRKQEEAERKAAERKHIKRVRAKERRKLKKLGEW
jgi:hypothetical protein